MIAVVYTHAHTNIVLAVVGIALAGWLTYESSKDSKHDVEHKRSTHQSVTTKGTNDR